MRNKRNRPIWRVYNEALSLVGAVGLLNTFRDLLDLKRVALYFLDAWEQFVRPAARFLFGWVEAIWRWADQFLSLPFDFPAWLYDYFVIGFVVTSACWRGLIDTFHLIEDDLNEKRVKSCADRPKATRIEDMDPEEVALAERYGIIAMTVVLFPIWPIAVASTAGHMMLLKRSFRYVRLNDFFLTTCRFGVYFVLLVVLNYTLFFLP